jgi:pyrimidine operon attenuation protein/uracil phosphoribosyltransferase
METRVKSVILDAEGIRRAFIRIAHEILEKHRAVEQIALVGIRSRGEFLAQRLAANLKELTGKPVLVGALDITLYRDDLSMLDANPIIRATEIPFDVTGKKVIIVDDVLFTGRTVRAAMDALIDLGRPETIELAVLIDRGHRELPVRADYIGKNVPTARQELVQVRLTEMDKAEEVTLGDPAPLDPRSLGGKRP